MQDQSGLNRQTSASPNTLILLARERHSLRCDHKTRAKRCCNMVWNSLRCARLSIQAESPLFPTDQPCSRLAVTRFSVVAASVIDRMVQPFFCSKVSSSTLTLMRDSSFCTHQVPHWQSDVTSYGEAADGEGAINSSLCGVCFGDERVVVVTANGENTSRVRTPHWKGRLDNLAQSPHFSTDQPCSRLAGTHFFSVVAAPVIDWMVCYPHFFCSKVSGSTLVLEMHSSLCTHLCAHINSYTHKMMSLPLTHSTHIPCIYSVEITSTQPLTTCKYTHFSLTLTKTNTSTTKKRKKVKPLSRTQGL
jgi:hypothetical protein